MERAIPNQQLRIVAGVIGLSGAGILMSKGVVSGLLFAFLERLRTGQHFSHRSGCFSFRKLQAGHQERHERVAQSQRGLRKVPANIRHLGVA